MKKVCILTLVGFFLVFSMVASASGPEDGHAGPGPSKPPHAGTMKEAAPMGWAGIPSLSKEQMDKMWLLEDKFHSDARTIGRELVQKQMEMEALYADPKITDAAILAKQKEITLTKQKLDDKITQLRLAQRKILTPEQLKELGARGFGFGHPEHCGRAPHAGRD
ncbi:MAG: hypothetical protein A4E62_01784 [Syntrophorhabdus sp. PtaU1.Bin002]|nr:MAG: hypothetical protein A4E62_01784 [Syntrophorhabdus sp. PtaU1.Bin002]